ncbi:aldehyde dehydrogenase family protein [Enterovibrio sp. Hal110]
MYGKTMNAGQTCVSPDYVYCPKNRVSELKRAIQVRYQSMYPVEEGVARRTRVINAKQYQRLLGYLDDAKQRGAEVIPLGEVSENPEVCYMPLTVVLGADRDMKVMQEEIFGPILPIVGYTTLEGVIADINDNPRPLALYIQSFDKAFQQTLLNNTHAGGYVSMMLHFMSLLMIYLLEGLARRESGAITGLKALEPSPMLNQC